MSDVSGSAVCFTIVGLGPTRERYSLDEMLEVNCDDEPLCEWLRSAKPGDRFEVGGASGVHSVVCYLEHQAPPAVRRLGVDRYLILTERRGPANPSGELPRWSGTILVTNLRDAQAFALAHGLEVPIEWSGPSDPVRPDLQWAILPAGVGARS